MIVSASRRTDIPAWYGPWFEGRLRAGRFLRVNPFNPRQRAWVDISRARAFVFWTKNPGPFLPLLSHVLERGHAALIQYTLNAYPASWEPGLPSLEERTGLLRRAAAMLPAGAVVWRYDPIILSDATDAAWHRQRFGYLARALEGAVDEVRLSFLTPYAKIAKRTVRLEQAESLRLEEARAWPQRCLDLAAELAAVARRHGIRTTACAEPLDLSGAGVMPGACVDAARLARLMGEDLGSCPAPGRDTGQRKHCLCAPSVDMGLYDSCRAGCFYCYARRSDAAARAFAARHDPEGPCLDGRYRDVADKDGGQLALL